MNDGEKSNKPKILTFGDHGREEPMKGKVDQHKGGNQKKEGRPGGDMEQWQANAEEEIVRIIENVNDG